MFRLSVNALIILITSIFFNSCSSDGDCIEGSGSIVTKTVTTQNFTGINLVGAASVVISQGDSLVVRATGHGNVIDRLEKNIYNDVWNIALEDGCYKNYQLTVYISTPILNSINISGSGNVTVNDFENQGDLSTSISGSGNMDLDTFAGTENLFVSISGSGTITGNHEFINLNNLNIKIAGSGTYNGYPIQAKQCDINISGSGNCYVYVRQNLNVDISGSGNVHYKGSPDIVKNITGSGNVIDEN